ncbi:hypothetical protein EPIB1_2075 [Tritonibacter mobilis]|nr:hypothetical protein EPIB1_2075 [Tritonibacter mobilis]
MVARSAAEAALTDKINATVVARARLWIIKVFLKTGWKNKALPRLYPQQRQISDHFET